MMKDLVLSKIVMSILKSARVTVDEVYFEKTNFSYIFDKIDLLNAIIIAHRKRYEQCYDDTMRNVEVDCLIKDYSSCFKKVDDNFISSDLVRSVFLFAVRHDFRSLQFRELCVELANNIANCTVQEMQYLCYLKLMQCIIRATLYGSEPFDSILDQCVAYFDSTPLSPEVLENIMFLE